MKQKIIASVFFLLEAGNSFFAWQSVHSAVFVPGASHFLIPGILFSLLAALLLVSVSLFTTPIFRMLGIVIAVLPVFLFAHSISISIAVGLAAILFYRSLFVVDRELSEHLKIRFFSSARTGVFMLAFGFSVLIVAFHAAMISQLPAEKLLPRFSLADGTGKMALQMAGKVNPALASLTEEDLSIDEFLLGLMPREDSEGGIDGVRGIGESFDPKDARIREVLKMNGIDAEKLSGISPTNAEFQKALFLKEGKRRVSDVLGRTVQGDERATDVLSEIINAKIFGTFSGVQKEGKSLDTLRAIIALLLFLSLLSLGSAFGLIWAFLSSVIFWILREGNIVAIRRMPIEAEQIVLVD
ncbi:MAG: hypothetical protein KA034_00180 [Candidatus Moranbacteria bacterium]|jgi:hypothetical protein|nr:hypothetical protein [Candidatus Moranbacteria bacterium]MDQ5961416.1 hypothetical protein [Patescibacteria group bacterium]